MVIPQKILQKLDCKVNTVDGGSLPHLQDASTKQTNFLNMCMENPKTPTQKRQQIGNDPMENGIQLGDKRIERSLEINKNSTTINCDYRQEVDKRHRNCSCSSLCEGKKKLQQQRHERKKCKKCSGFATITPKRRHNYSDEFSGREVDDDAVNEKLNKGIEEAIECDAAENGVYGKSPVNCIGNGHCDRGTGAQNKCTKIRLPAASSSSLLTQSKPQQSEQNDDWLSEQPFCGDDGENKLIMESGLPTNSKYRGFTACAVNKKEIKTETSQQQPLSNNTVYTVTVAKTLVNSKTSRGGSISNYRTTDDAAAAATYTYKCKSFKRSSNNNNVIIISSTVTVSNLFRPLFNFILLTSFLLHTFNYCDVVQGEVLSTAHSKLYKNSILGSRSAFSSENVPLPPLLPNTLAESSSLSPPLNNDQLHRNGNDNRSSVVRNLNKRVDNDVHSVSHGKVENERKLTSTASSLAATEETLRNLLSQPLEGLDKSVLLKTLWEALTLEEIRSIFGHHPSTSTSSAFFKAVPNFDITKPKLTHLHHHHHERRKRRSPLDSSSTNTSQAANNSKHNHRLEESSKKLIKLDGFGRQFTLNVHPNQKLLDPYFVHLHRHENRSEILPQELVRKQLGCFYHGSASHQGSDERDVEQGAVALSLCGGMKGFILPGPLPTTGTGSADGQQFHYVIHPLPDRLLKSVASALPSEEPTDREKNTFFSFADADNEGHNRHHIIFRRPGTPFPKLAPKPSAAVPEEASLKVTRGRLSIHNKHNDNLRDGSSSELHNIVKTDVGDDEFPTCMHHDTASTTVQNGKVSRMKYDSRNNNKNNDNDYGHHDRKATMTTGGGSGVASTNNELDPTLLSASELQKQQQQQQQYRMEPIILSALYEDPEYSPGINDLESLTDEERMRLLVLSSPTSGNRGDDDANVRSDTGHNFRRQKRSTITNFDTDTIDPFTYKPINVAPDSYWLQFRDRSGGGGPLRSSSTITSGSNPFANSNSRRLSSQFSYDSGIPSGPSRFASGGTSGPSSSFQPSFWHPSSPPVNQQRSIHGSSSNPQNNLPARPARGSRYDEIPTSEYDDTGVAGSDMTWSKGILVFESSASAEDRHYPGKDVPFYTKNKQRKSKGISTSSSVVASTSSTSSKTSSSNTRSFDWFGSGVGINDSGSSASNRPSWNSSSKSFSVSDGSSPSRKGRRDDGVFGDTWKSSLDSEIIWADRSNEINKQSRFEDISNVKDRPRSHLTIETAVFVDKDLYKHMQQNFPEDTQGEVTRIVLAMINAVQLLYQDPSLGHRVDFVLKRLEVLESDPPSLIRPYDIDRFLTNFCKWQKTENPASDADPLHWDHALILTGLDLYVVHQSGKISNQVVGLAPVAGMCTRSSSCTVNEGRHFESVFVVAHEIGHNLGMRHDGPQAENNCDPTSHIMSPTLGSGKITWSPCSKKYLDLFLDTPQAKCLFDKAKSERWLDHDADGRLPGERFDADRQCVLKYGRGSFHATQQPLEDVCRDLHCRREFFTWTSHPALDGTRCSAADDMWCRAGKCVLKITGPSSSSINSYEISGLGGNNGKNDAFSGGSNHLPGSETAAYVTQKTLDGGWGKWSPFTDCSSACLYADDGTLTMGSNGVRLAARRCDSPRPENGGRQCSGPDRRYKSCSAHKICTKNPTRTTVSQYATEVCSRAAQVDTELTGRGYMSSSNDPERACSVWCETNDNSGPRSRGWSFPDGTTCNLMSLPKSAQTYCVAGKCQEFTCNPYSHFRLSEDDCILTSSNDVIPSSNKNSNTETWFGGASGGVKINHRSGKVGWTDWEVQTDCKLACLAPAKGLQLVKRQCASDDALCTGLSLSVRLCKPDKYTVQTNGCSRLQTPFEYATKVCSKYSEKVTGLSGIGMQLSPTKEDTDRPCRIGCQDASIAYRFYMVNGEEGWFPAGTDCSRGDQDKKAYCMAGKCVDFGDDDTPMYQLNNNVMGSLFQQSTRNKRQAVYNIMEPLKTEPGMDESSLKQLVHKFSQETGNYPSIVQRSRGGSQSQRRTNILGSNSIDFSKPILVQSSSSNFAYSGGGRTPPYTYTYPDTNNIFLTKKKNALGDPYSSYNNKEYSNRDNRGRSLDMEVVDVKSDWEAHHNPSSPNFGHRSGQISGPSGNLKSQPIEGSFYEWRKIVSDCSVACGTGIQELIVQCVSGDTVVNDSLCQGRPRPGYSGYISCHKADCARSSTATSMGNDQGSGSHIWNWIQSILPPKNMSYTDGRS